MGWSKGHKMSEEQKAAISRARKGMKFSDEHRANIALSRIGTEATEETKNKLSVMRRQKCNTPEWRQRMSEQTTNGWKDPDIRAAMRDGQQANFESRPNGSNFPTETPQTELDFIPLLCPLGYIHGYVIPTHRPENNGGGYYKLDFAHLEAKVDIEIDGSSHRGKKNQDGRRDTFLRAHGWKVIRIKV